MLGCVLEGGFMMLWPKRSFAVEVISLFFVGAGMGLVDGAAPALLGQETDRLLGPTGKVYVLSNFAVQGGFLLGPLVGNMITQAAGFTAASIVCGASLVLYTLVLLGVQRVPEAGADLGERASCQKEAAPGGTMKADGGGLVELGVAECRDSIVLAERE